MHHKTEGLDGITKQQKIMFKRTIKLLTLAVIVFVGSNATAQTIALYKTLYDVTSMQTSEYCPDILYNFEANSDKGVLRIYNQDFVCIKQVELYSSEDYLDYGRIYISCVCKNVFTNSGKYEFIVYGKKTNYFDEINLHGLYNEDGELLYDFGEGLSNAQLYSYDYPLH